MPKTTGKSKKIFVLDTNVVFHESTCVTRDFGENDVVIPMAVLREVDKYKQGKNGKDDVQFHARQFARILEAYAAGDTAKGGCVPNLYTEGTPRGAKLGMIKIVLERDPHERIKKNLVEDTNDHRIINTACWLQEECPDREVVLVSKDINCRHKARAIGITAEDYTTDRVNIKKLYSGRRELIGVPTELINKIYDVEGTISAAELAESLGLNTLKDSDRFFYPNECLIIKDGNKKGALGIYDHQSDVVYRKLDQNTFAGISPRNAEQIFALNLLRNEDIKLITFTGKAGTGKTLMALAGAIDSRSRYRQICLARPVVPLSNKDSGYLPGDIQAKINLYMMPLFDNLNVIKDALGKQGASKIEEYLDNGKIQILPLHYIRGRSFLKIFLIVDEAQNLTPHEVKTIITRAGADTKIIFTGDIFQIDHPYLSEDTNGLAYVIEKFKGEKIYAHINFEKCERSELADIAACLL